jgi:hypothetical protein
MGTSTVHRSPSTPHWRVVRSLYRDSTVSRPRLLVEVLRAAATPYIEGLSGPEATHGLVLALRALSSPSAPVTADAALALAKDLISESRRRVLTEGWSSFYGDLANRALHATILAAGGESESGRRPPSIVRLYLANVVATCVDHVVSRDLSAHFGKGELIGTATRGLAISADLKSAARQVASDPALVSALREAAKSPERHWRQLVIDAWSVGSSGTHQPDKGER